MIHTEKGFPAAQYIYGDAIRYCLDYLDTHPQMECAQEIRTLALSFDAMSITDRRRKDMADSFRNLV